MKSNSSLTSLESGEMLHSVPDPVLHSKIVAHFAVILFMIDFSDSYKMWTLKIQIKAKYCHIFPSYPQEGRRILRKNISYSYIPCENTYIKFYLDMMHRRKEKLYNTMDKIFLKNSYITAMGRIAG